MFLYKGVILAVDYFLKWTEGKAIPNKTAVEMVRFLFEFICRHGCPQIQINDNGKEFVNNIAQELHKLTGTQQRLTSPYHPQANRLVERQNKTVKEKKKKTLLGNMDKWSDVLEGALFSHRTSKHKTTGFSQFYLLYNREPLIPLDFQTESFIGAEEMIFPEDEITDEIIQE